MDRSPILAANFILTEKEKKKSTKVNIFEVNLSQCFPNFFCFGEKTLVNQGPDSTFIDEASSTRLSLSPRSSQVIKLIGRTQLTRPRGESRVMSTLFYISLFDLSSNQNQAPFEQKFATFASRAVFVSLFFSSKTVNL